RAKKDVQEFQYKLSDNILNLHKDLKNKTYVHGGYYAFNISDPKPRNIHKATVRDRLLHHAIYRQLYPFFDQTFIYDSYSCRKFRGAHRALERFKSFAYRGSRNNTKVLWVLKCDIRKFFASVDQKILTDTVRRYITNKDVNWLVNQVVKSFQSTAPGKGMPLGNLTSQLLVNVYMNVFDYFMKHEIKAKHYIRYADDFVVMSRDKDWLLEILPKISIFLEKELKLNLHPDKISIKTFTSGIDFLGWVHFPDHRVLRTATKKRMFKRLMDTPEKPEVIQSYLGLLSHGNAKKLQGKIQDISNLGK
ncbi:group II intron reverse transcriptase domain-containing protein, partial [Candidatus Nomurabacteria bacterium]|nr:group II intron reverse transcriptase domain-containing protein [Candidatus Nomurabacteria bacterium]